MQSTMLKKSVPHLIDNQMFINVYLCHILNPDYENVKIPLLLLSESPTSQINQLQTMKSLIYDELILQKHK